MSMQPVSAAPSDEEALRGIREALASERPGIVGADGECVPIPEALVEVLREAAAGLLTGRAVSVQTVGQQLTTQQAADLLNVSRPYLIKLLEEGALPFTLVGTHRRVPLAELLAYDARQSAVRREALREIVRLSEEMGLYEH
ncbi:MAG: excisionase family DNA-binding protein [Dehalococcoidia bacterium]